VITVVIALAGSLGAMTRFAVDGAFRKRWNTSFPWATVIINVSGSLVLGILTGLVLFQGDPANIKLIAGTGFCGGYTTFSTASFETVRLAQRGAYLSAVGNGLGTVLLTVAAGGLGLAITH
jgi:fluoride exporter